VLWKKKKKIHLLTYCVNCSSFLTLLSIGSTLCHNCCHWLIIPHLPQGNPAHRRRDQHRRLQLLTLLSIGSTLYHNCCYWLLISPLTPRESRTSKMRSASALTYPKGIPHVKDAISIGIALLIASLTPSESRTSKTRSASALLSWSPNELRSSLFISHLGKNFMKDLGAHMHMLIKNCTTTCTVANWLAAEKTEWFIEGPGLACSREDWMIYRGARPGLQQRRLNDL